uniref:Uncharacterized protein n=1 Tax=Rhizophora mucronata TaxID=61149 RepID=A0A2P2QK31_RHIMU
MFVLLCVENVAFLFFGHSIYKVEVQVNIVEINLSILFSLFLMF